MPVEDIHAPAVSSRPAAPTRIRSRQSLVAYFLLSYLGAITIFGKGPTYIGIQPIFWGEVLLVLSLAWAVRRWEWVVLPDGGARLLTVLVCAFLLLGAVESAMDFDQWGLDALRDSAIWYYALFYFVGLAIAADSSRWEWFCSRWKFFWILAVPWGTLDYFTDHVLSASSPGTPFGGPVLFGSGSDVAQSVGIGCLILITEKNGSRFLGAIPRVLLCMAGLAMFVLYDARGERLAVLAAFALTIALSRKQTTARTSTQQKFYLVVLFAMIGAVIATAAGFDLTKGFSAARIEEISLDTPEGTTAWRTDWWKNLTDEVMTRNPLLGLGFGDPLYEYNPHISEVSESKPVRSPHNYNMSVFSRMGIVGAAVWLGILIVGVFGQVWRLFSRSQLSDATARQRAFFTIVLIAIWIDASFGVLMEGPVMGIPFWLIMGLTIGRSKHVSRSAYRRILTTAEVNIPGLVRE